MSQDTSDQAYSLPKATGETAAETTRLNDQHEMLVLAAGGLTTAPLTSTLSKVLDIGCGTGIWCSQMAMVWPQAQFLGVDIFPPSVDANTPKNISFTRANVEQDWTWAEESTFDFVFARALIAGLRDWNTLFRRIFAHLKEGGLFEIHEAVGGMESEDGGITIENSPMLRWVDGFRTVIQKSGIDPLMPLQFKSLLEDVGFEVIQDRQIRLYADAEVARSKGGVEVAQKLRTDMKELIKTLGEKICCSEQQQEALEDLDQHGAKKGYYFVHVHLVVRKPARAA